MGSMMGMAVGDAIGAPLEFSPLCYSPPPSAFLSDFSQSQFWNHTSYNSFNLRPGQWTDDASMGLCLADSLLCCKGFNPKDLRLRFLLWWHHGYNNAFMLDDSRGGSVGLGGNISQSFSEFSRKETAYTTAGDKFTSGNGSIMRAAAVPIYFHDDIEKAMKFSYKQSKTTHQGDEAAECARLLAFIIVNAINSTITDIAQRKQDVLLQLDNFKSDVYSIQCLSKSLAEKKHLENKKLNLKDRNWNWKDTNFKYCASRSKKQPGYIGSYAMDCMAMSLHCVWTTSSFKEATLKSANLRGDADTVTAVVGQIAGAIYGIYGIPKSWIETVQKWDSKTITLRAYKLFHKDHSNVFGTYESDLTEQQ